MGVSLPVVYGQGDLGVFHHHAHQGRQPQPENCAVAAKGNGLGGADYVAGAHRSSQGRGHGLEGGDGSVARLSFFKHLAGGVFHGVAEATELNETGPHGKQYAAYHDTGQEDVQPRHRVQGSRKEIQNCLHIVLSFIHSSFFKSMPELNVIPVDYPRPAP